ncbi:hypothetical protein [Nonomuraea sp. NPDC005650]|uniref:hypothetical protein n=1 Tax=Nonomuraea sp. NPDC005650 TaxID=3157045 RepID=UPI0033BD047D
MSFPRRKSAATTAAAAVIAVAGCGSTYDERMSYLHKVASRGVDTYKLLYSQEAHIDKARCERAFEGNSAGSDVPGDYEDGSTAVGWRAQVKVLRGLLHQRQAQAPPG